MDGDKVLIHDPTVERPEIISQEALAARWSGEMILFSSRASLAGELAKSLGLLDRRDLLWFQHEKSEGKAPVVEVTFKMKQHKKTSAFVVSKSLNKSKIQLEIGRMDLGGFLVGENS
jgi:hypothetical protein